MTLLFVGSALALAAWLCVLVLPYQPHRVRERLEADADRLVWNAGFTVSVSVMMLSQPETAGRVSM